MPPNQQPLELQLLVQSLDSEFGRLIQGEGNGDAARRSNFLSKAVAAFVLVQEAGATVQEAVAASIDGGGDHGIDSVHIGIDGTLWITDDRNNMVLRLAKS